MSLHPYDLSCEFDGLLGVDASDVAHVNRSCCVVTCGALAGISRAHRPQGLRLTWGGQRLEARAPRKSDCVTSAVG